jgi:hypothetical protein
VSHWPPAAGMVAQRIGLLAMVSTKLFQRDGDHAVAAKKSRHNRGAMHPRKGIVHNRNGGSLGGDSHSENTFPISPKGLALIDKFALKTRIGRAEVLSGNLMIEACFRHQAVGDPPVRGRFS